MSPVLRGSFENSFTQHVAVAHLENAGTMLRVYTRSGTALQLCVAVVPQLLNYTLMLGHRKAAALPAALHSQVCTEAKQNLRQQPDSQTWQQIVENMQTSQQPRCVPHQRPFNKGQHAQRCAETGSAVVAQFGCDNGQAAANSSIKSHSPGEDWAYQRSTLDSQQAKELDMCKDLPTALESLAKAKVPLTAIAQICPIMLETYTLCCDADQKGLRRFHAKLQRRLGRTGQRKNLAAASLSDFSDTCNRHDAVNSYHTDNPSALSGSTECGPQDILACEADQECYKIQESSGGSFTESHGSAGEHQATTQAMASADSAHSSRGRRVSGTHGDRDGGAVAALQRQVYLSVFPVCLKQR